MRLAVRLEPLVVLAWTAVTAAMVFGDLQGVPRIFFAIVFVAVVPGLVAVRLMGFGDLMTRVLIAVPLSLSIAALVGGILVYAGGPSWDLALTLLISLTVAGVIVDLVRPRVVMIPMPDLRVPGKLNDEDRQARLMQSLLEGGSLDDAAAAAGVSRTTLIRSMKRSAALLRAMEIASHGTLPPLPQPRPRRERRRLNPAEPAQPGD